MRYVQNTLSSNGLWGHSPSEMRYRDPQAFSSTLAMLRTLQPEPSGPRGPQLVVCAYEISKSDEYNELCDTDYTRIYCSLYGDC